MGAAPAGPSQNLGVRNLAFALNEGSPYRVLSSGGT